MQNSCSALQFTRQITEEPYRMSEFSCPGDDDGAETCGVTETETQGFVGHSAGVDMLSEKSGGGTGKKTKLDAKPGLEGNENPVSQAYAARLCIFIERL